MESNFELSLEAVDAGQRPPVFRLAFSSSSERLLLPYPEVTGLQFLDAAGEKVAEWRTAYLSITPLDEFVLRPGGRIAFDLETPDKLPPAREHDWTIQLPPGRMSVRYVYEVEADKKRYDFLAKGSRFAAITKFWGGRVESPMIEFDA